MNFAQNRVNKRLYSQYTFNHSYPNKGYFKSPLDTLNNKVQMVRYKKINEWNI